jgi:hypothetical protein
MRMWVICVSCIGNHIQLMKKQSHLITIRLEKERTALNYRMGFILAGACVTLLLASSWVRNRSFNLIKEPPFNGNAGIPSGWSRVDEQPTASQNNLKAYEAELRKIFFGPP